MTSWIPRLAAIFWISTLPAAAEPKLSSEKSIPTFAGLRVTEVNEGSVFASLGLHLGDTILAINGKRVTTSKSALEFLRNLVKEPPGTPVRLKIVRDGKTGTLTSKVK